MPDCFSLVVLTVLAPTVFVTVSPGLTLEKSTTILIDCLELVGISAIFLILTVWVGSS